MPNKLITQTLQFLLKHAVLCALLLTFLLRLYRIHYPLGDWHSWRQSDTASVTREFVKHQVDFLHPTYHDLSTIPNGLNNTEHGYRMVEFPIINGLIAIFLKNLPFLPLVATSRFFSVVASLGTAISLYKLVKKLSGEKVALLTLITFAVLPYSIYYSRVILPEPYMLFFSTLSLLSFYNWLQKDDWKWFFISSSSLALALLLKPFAFFLGPVFVSLFFYLKGYKNLLFQLKKYFFPLVCFTVIASTPLFLWREWIKQFPEGIPASDWLYNGNGIRFRPAWVRWLGYERITKLISGYFGVIFLAFTFFKFKKASVVYLSWWLGIAAYFTVFATGNVQHDYYQALIIPIVSISIGLGTFNAYHFVHKFMKASFSLLGVTTVYILMLFFAWQMVKGYFNVNHWEYVEAGQRADQLLPSDAKIIAPSLGDTQFLFQTNRTGWPIGGEIKQKISQGATHYLSTNYDDETRELEAKYTLIEKTDKYILIDLTREKVE